MRIQYALLLGTSLTIFYNIYAQVPQGISFFSPRSQTANAARELISDQHFLYQHVVKPGHLFETHLIYQQSLQAERLAMIMFGNDFITVSGSQVNNRERDALLADHFGLSPTFKSTMQISPKYKSVIFPFTTYINLNRLVCGMYLRIQAPFIWNQSELLFREKVLDTGTNTLFPQNYMGKTEIIAPYASFSQALQNGTRFGFAQEGLRYGKLGCTQSTKTIGNTTWDLGWNVLLDDERHFGFKVRLVTPNGTRPKSEFLYEPLVGNGKHWEFGFGINGHTRIWEQDDTQELSVYGNLLLTHLFDTRQCRSFNLKDNGYFSRYILTKEFDQTGAFTGTIFPLINRTTLNCDVRASMQFDGAIMLAYTNKDLTFNVGYNGWFRTKEKIELLECLPKNRFGLKGIQNVIDDVNQLSRETESNATIFGTNFDNQNMVADTMSPQFINTKDLDLKSARSPFVFTHKLFAYIGHTCSSLHKQYFTQPFVGLGGEIEFQGINESNNPTNTVDKHTLSQWALWLRAGVLFG